MDLDLLGHRENIIIVARVGIAYIVHSQVISIAIVSVGIGTMVDPLPGFLQQVVLQVHGDGMSCVAVQH